MALQLPPEILYLILNFLQPDNPDVILPLNDPLTRTLHSLLFTSRLVSSYATKLLYRHCVYIDSALGAQKFSQCVARYPKSATPPITAMYLSPYPLDSEWGNEFSPLHNTEITDAVHNILLSVSPSLQRLIINIPLRSLWPEDDINRNRPKLRQAFESLVNLEEFVSVQDELFLRTEEDHHIRQLEVWATCWPRLRHLALYNVMVDQTLWDALAGMGFLETFIAPRPDPPEMEYSDDVQSSWEKAVNRTARNRPTEGTELTSNPIVFVHVDVLKGEEELLILDHTRINKEAVNFVHFLNVGVPLPDDAAPKDNITAVQEWVERSALAGRLFNVHALDAMSQQPQN